MGLIIGTTEDSDFEYYGVICFRTIAEIYVVKDMKYMNIFDFVV